MGYGREGDIIPVGIMRPALRSKLGDVDVFLRIVPHPKARSPRYNPRKREVHMDFFALAR